MTAVKTIMVAGLGLIGGSLARNIKQHQQVTLIGYDQQQKTLDYALKHGIIDEAVSHFADGVQKSDILLLAAPVGKTIELLLELDKLPLKHELIVSDVSSVKGPVLSSAASLKNKNIHFIGGHPMAGSHKQGIEASKAHLFENAIYVLTPADAKAAVHIAELKQLLSGTKSKFMELTTEEHDEMTGVISHFPHLVASALVKQAKKWESKHPYLPQLAAGGFRDITRIASSNPNMWQDIFFQNKDKMQILLDDWIQEMQDLRSMLDHDEIENLNDYLTDAKSYRDGLQPRKKGAILSYYDLYVDVADQPGALHQVLALLAEAGISIANIQILELREGLTGVLRLSFHDSGSQLQSKELLIKKGYEAKLEE